MTRLERNRQQAATIIARIERNMEISQLCRAGQLIKTGQFTKQELQALISNLQPKRGTTNG
jgi:hypothetical protein